MYPDPDPHQSDKLDPDPDLFADDKQKFMEYGNIFKHFFKVLSLYLEARMRIQNRIRKKVKGRIRIRIRIKVTSGILFRIKVIVPLVSLCSTCQREKV